MKPIPAAQLVPIRLYPLYGCKINAGFPSPADDYIESRLDLNEYLVKHKEAKRGFVLLPRRWVVERTFAWLGRFRRLARDYERLGKTLEAWHWLAAVALLLGKAAFQSA